jgi:hypothetical protein
MKTSTYELKLTLEAPVHIPQEILEGVLDHSTAVAAIEEGIWNWLFPKTYLTFHSETDTTDDIFTMSLSVVKGRFDEGEPDGDSD